MSPGEWEVVHLHSWTVSHLGRLRGLNEDRPGLPRGRGMDGMAPGGSALPASSGCQSQSAASVSPGSAQRSPSWWSGGRPRAGRPTAAAPRTGSRRSRRQGWSGQRREGGEFPGPNRLPRCCPGALPLPPALSITPSLYHLLALPFILHVCRLHPTAGPFLYPALQASSPAPDFSLPQTQHPAELPVTL